MRLVGGDGGQMEARRTPNDSLGVVEGRWRPGEPTNESRRLVGVGGGQMWLASQAEGSVWLALQVEGVGEPPTSRNDSLGVNVA